MRTRGVRLTALVSRNGLLRGKNRRFARIQTGLHCGRTADDAKMDSLGQRPGESNGDMRLGG